MDPSQARPIDLLISRFQENGPILPRPCRAQQPRNPLQRPPNAPPRRDNAVPPHLAAPVVQRTAPVRIQPLAANPGVAVGQQHGAPKKETPHVPLPIRHDPMAHGKSSALGDSVVITRPSTPSPPAGNSHPVSERPVPTPYSVMPSVDQALKIANELPIDVSRPGFSLVPRVVPDGKQNQVKQNAEGDRKPAASNYGSIPTGANTQEPASKAPPKRGYDPIPTGPKPLSTAPTNGSKPTVSGASFIHHDAPVLESTRIPQRPRNGVALPRTKPPRPETRPPLQSNGTANQK
jgi:hypothetical protein